MKRSFLRLTVLALCLVPTAALAHPGHGESGAMHTFEHLLIALDHHKWAVTLGGIAIVAIIGMIGVARRAFSKAV